MASSRRYYDLIASLPSLPYFERAERMPINAVRLANRLRMLEDDDLEIVQRLYAFLDWQRQPIDRTDEETARMYGEFVKTAGSQALVDIAEYRISQRNILAGLRRKRLRQPAPETMGGWERHPWAMAVRRHWDAPDFKLSGVFPWIPDVREALERGDSKEVDRLIFAARWHWLEALAFGDDFSFEALLAYLFKWRILDQWLSYDVPAARARFEVLVAEVTGEHYRLFD